MDFLKKHYEKVLLGIVLLVLVAATASLPFIKSAQETQIDEIIRSFIQPRVVLLSNLDLTIESNSVARAAAPFQIDFGQPNKLFNPMPWIKAADGHLIPDNGTNLGPAAVTVTKITPLFLIVSLDQVMVSDTGVRYGFAVTRQAAQKPDQRSKHSVFCTVGGKTDSFTLLSVHGPPENPTNVVLQLSDVDEPVKAGGTNGAPYKRIDNYMADLKYDPEKRHWENCRVGAVLTLNGEDYKIVAISENEVVLSAPNNKKWTRPYNPSNLASNSNTPATTPPNQPP